MMTDLRGRPGPVAEADSASARSRCGRAKPPRPRAPMRMKLRRETPSQNRERPPYTVSTPAPSVPGGGRGPDRPARTPRPPSLPDYNQVVDAADDTPVPAAPIPQPLAIACSRGYPESDSSQGSSFPSSNFSPEHGGSREADPGQP